MKKKTLKNSTRYPVQERSRATVDAILEATAQIMVKQGHARISTNLIAARAGVSIGGLYQYFKNREAILKKLCLREREADFLALQEALSTASEVSIEDGIAILLLAALERFLDHPELRRILDSAVHLRTQDPQMMKIRKQLAELLTHALKARGYNSLPEDIELRIEVLVAGFEGSLYAALELFGKDLDSQSFLRDSTKMVVSFLGNYK